MHGNKNNFSLTLKFFYVPGMCHVLNSKCFTLIIKFNLQNNLRRQVVLSMLIIEEYANCSGHHQVTTNQDRGEAAAESSQHTCFGGPKGMERKGEHIGS